MHIGSSTGGYLQSLQQIISESSHFTLSAFHLFYLCHGVPCMCFSVSVRVLTLVAVSEDPTVCPVCFRHTALLAVHLRCRTTGRWSCCARV